MEHQLETPVEEQGKSLRWEARSSPRQTIVYVAKASAGEEARRKRTNQVARCRRRAKSLDIKIVRVFDNKEAALRYLEEGQTKAVIVLSITELASRPRDAMALGTRLRKAGAQLISCELTAQEVAAKKEAAARKRSKDGSIHFQIRLTPGRLE